MEKVEEGGREKERERGHQEECNPSETPRRLGFIMNGDRFELFFLDVKGKGDPQPQKKDLGTDISSSHLDCIISFLSDGRIYIMPHTFLPQRNLGPWWASPLPQRLRLLS